MSKQGFIVFDVPDDRSYKLKLSGGFWSVDDAFVELDPSASLESEAAKQAAERERQATEEQRKAEEEQRIAAERERKIVEGQIQELQSQLEQLEQASMRTWTSKNGKHTTESRYIGHENLAVTIEKDDKKQVTVKLDSLSKDDQEYVRNQVKVLREIQVQIDELKSQL